ncbi:V-set and immunoglobulin domain-containing protein 1-like isoform X2 [Trichomycterus rosablanca]
MSARILVQDGENATIYCNVGGAPQDGVYMYKDRYNRKKMCYFYNDGTFSPNNAYKDRLQTNSNLHNFSLTIFNVTKQDSDVYWCSFNNLDKITESSSTLLIVTGAKCKMDNATYVYYPYLYVISFQFFFVVILVILLGKLCHDLRKNKPVKQSSNSEYEVMRGGQTARFLTNPQYDFTRCNTNNEPEMQICKK